MHAGRDTTGPEGWEGRRGSDGSVLTWRLPPENGLFFVLTFGYRGVFTGGLGWPAVLARFGLLAVREEA